MRNIFLTFLTTLVLVNAALTSEVLANSISKLMTATQQGNIKLVAQIIAQIPINSRDAKARTAIHNAIVHNQPAILDFLIVNGADPNLIDADGNTPYDLYMQDKNDEIGRILRNTNALTAEEIVRQLDTYDENSTAGKALALRHSKMLFIAAEEGDREAIELLLEAGANPKAKNNAGEFPFHLAAKNRHFACCAILLKAIGGVDRGDNKSWTPLHWALLAKDWDMVRELMREGATLRIRSSSNAWQGQDAYYIAERTKQENLFLTTAFAEQNEKMIHDLMEKATRQGRLDIYQKLLDNGLSLQTEKEAEVALRLLLHYTNVYTEDLMDFLLANNINKSAVAKKITSHNALTNAEIMKKILEYGIAPDTPDPSGNIALVAAAEKASVPSETIKLLLEHGADPNLTDKRGMTPIITKAKRATSNYTMYSKLNESDYLEFLRILLEHGADPNAVLERDTALDILQRNLQQRTESSQNHVNPPLAADNIATVERMIELLLANGAINAPQKT